MIAVISPYSRSAQPFFWYWPLLRKKMLLWATFTKIKLQVIASLLYKIGAHFGQYFGDLSPKEGENQKKRFSHQIGADFNQFYGNLSPKAAKEQKENEVFATNLC